MYIHPENNRGKLIKILEMKFLLMHEFDAGVKMRFSICDNGNNIFLEVINDMIYGFNLVFLDFTTYILHTGDFVSE